MPNPFEKLKKKFSIVMNLRPGFTSKYQAQVDEQEGPSAAVPIPEEEPAVAMHMQEEEQAVAVAAPGEIEELLNLVSSNSKHLKKESGAFSAQLSGELEASAKLVQVKDGLRRLIDLNVITAVTFELKADYASQYANFSAHLGLYAKASIAFNVDFMNIKKGEIIVADFTADVRAAATATASVEVEFGFGALGAIVAGSAEAYAIAEASVSGTLRITASGIAIGGNVKVGATAGVSIEGSASLAFRGTKVISLSSKLEASVGAEAEFGGSFSFVNGVLKIKVDLGLTVGAGGAIHEDLEVDFAAIKEIIKGELEILGNELKEKINTYLKEQMDIIIAALEEAGAEDIAQTLLNRTEHIDSDLYSEDETLNLQFLKTNRNSPWEALKRIRYAGKDAKLIALQEIIDRLISLTNKKQP